MKVSKLAVVPWATTLIVWWVAPGSVLASQESIPVAADQGAATTPDHEAAATALAQLEADFEASELKTHKLKGAAFRDRYRQFANEYRGTASGLKALFWLFGDCWWKRSEDEQLMFDSARTLATEILQHYPDDPDLDAFVEKYYVMDVKLRAEVYRQLHDSKVTRLQAAGRLGLARTLQKTDADRSRQHFEDLAQNYADSTLRYSTYGEIANANLNKHEASALEVGQLAPEISGRDPDGQTMKLSDYRGKVVLLDFWGDW